MTFDPDKCLVNETGHTWYRAGAGPTGTKKDWLIRVDYCRWCGWLRPVDGDNLSHIQKDWIARYNRHIEQTEAGRRGDV